MICIKSGDFLGSLIRYLHHPNCRQPFFCQTSPRIPDWIPIHLRDSESGPLVESSIIVKMTKIHSSCVIENNRVSEPRTEVDLSIGKRMLSANSND